MIIKPVPRRPRWDFTEPVFSFLNLEVGPQETIWHYTSGHSLIAIVENHQLFATQVACLNDRTEVSYGEKLLEDAIKQTWSMAKSELERWLLETVLTAFQYDTREEIEPILPRGRSPVSPSTESKDVWVTCFSAEKDDLSQWRAYGGGENGYAIGFAAERMSDNESRLLRVNYSRTDHEQAATLVAEQLRDSLLHVAEANYYPDLDDPDFTTEMSFFVEQFVQDATIGFAPMLKDPAFKNERECRYICESYGWGERELRFIQRQTLMSTHLVRKFVDGSNDILPIREVVIGPCRHPEVSRMSVCELLRKHGYGGVRVTSSAIPFQLT